MERVQTVRTRDKHEPEWWEECPNEEYLDRYVNLKVLEQQNDKEARTRVNEFIAEFSAEEPGTVKDGKTRFLKAQIIDLEVEIELALLRYKVNLELDIPYKTRAFEWFFDDVELKKKQLKKLTLRLRFVENGEYLKAGAISEEMIQAARDFPITELIETNSRGYALCPFHPEKTPSFFTKNNYGHCFGCGWSGDVIDLVRERNKLNFVQAVRKLAAGNGKQQGE